MFFLDLLLSDSHLIPRHLIRRYLSSLSKTNVKTTLSTSTILSYDTVFAFLSLAACCLAFYIFVKQFFGFFWRCE